VRQLSSAAVRPGRGDVAAPSESALAQECDVAVVQPTEEGGAVCRWSEAHDLDPCNRVGISRFYNRKRVHLPWGVGRTADWGKRHRTLLVGLIDAGCILQSNDASSCFLHSHDALLLLPAPLPLPLPIPPPRRPVCQAVLTCRSMSIEPPLSGWLASSMPEVSHSVTTPSSVPVAKQPETRCQDIEETAPRKPPS
jgi:hypothetical protein